MKRTKQLMTWGELVEIVQARGISDDTPVVVSDRDHAYRPPHVSHGDAELYPDGSLGEPSGEPDTRPVKVIIIG